MRRLCRSGEGISKPALEGRRRISWCEQPHEARLCFLRVVREHSGLRCRLLRQLLTEPAHFLFQVLHPLLHGELSHQRDECAKEDRHSKLPTSVI